MKSENKRLHKRIGEYDKLVDTINNIDEKISGNSFSQDIKKYEAIQKNNEEEKNESQNANRKRNYER